MEKLLVHGFPAINSPACVFYRLYAPLRALNDDVCTDSFKATLLSNYPDPNNLCMTEQMCEAQIIVFQRYCMPQFLPLLDLVLANGKKVVYEVDDDLFNLPPQNPHYKLYTQQLKDTIKQFASKAHLVTVSTEPLREVMLKYNDNVVVLPNSIDFRLISPRTKNNKKVIVGYQGAHEHKSEFKLLKNLLNTLTKKEYKEKVHIKLFGYSWPGCETIRYFPFEFFHEALRLANFDIGLAPIANNQFNVCKSNLKWLEYGSFETVTIASNVYPYSNSISDEVDGLVIQDSNDWLDCINLLLDHFDLLQQMQSNVFQRVKEEFDVLKNCLLWLDAYKKILEMN